MTWIRFDPDVDDLKRKLADGFKFPAFADLVPLEDVSPAAIRKRKLTKERKRRFLERKAAK